jgi:hypothetical protein
MDETRKDSRRGRGAALRHRYTRWRTERPCGDDDDRVLGGWASGRVSESSCQPIELLVETEEREEGASRM